jgi:hypothetical protein
MSACFHGLHGRLHFILKADACQHVKLLILRSHFWLCLMTPLQAVRYAVKLFSDQLLGSFVAHQAHVSQACPSSVYACAAVA